MTVGTHKDMLSTASTGLETLVSISWYSGLKIASLMVVTGGYDWTECECQYELTQ